MTLTLLSHLQPLCAEQSLSPETAMIGIIVLFIALFGFIYLITRDPPDPPNSHA